MMIRFDGREYPIATTAYAFGHRNIENAAILAFDVDRNECPDSRSIAHIRRNLKRVGDQVFNFPENKQCLRILRRNDTLRQFAFNFALGWQRERHFACLDESRTPETRMRELPSHKAFGSPALAFPRAHVARGSPACRPPSALRRTTPNKRRVKYDHNSDRIKSECPYPRETQSYRDKTTVATSPHTQ